MTPRYFEPAPPSLIAWRKNVFFTFLVLLFLGLVIGGPLRVSSLADEAQSEAESRHFYESRLFAHRGDIVDKNGRPLAVSADVYDVRADMQVMADIPRERLTALLPQLSDILQVPSEFLTEKFERTGRSELLKKELPPAQYAELRKFRRRHRLGGVVVDYNSKRYYPQKEYSASIVGYTNHEDVGKNGIEFVYHQRLSPVEGRIAGTRTRTGLRLESAAFTPAQNGGDVTLSIDSRLQFYAFEELQRAMLRHGAKAGAAAVMDVRTGDILAMASVPTFNPNNIKPGVNEKNHAVSDAVEPGSLVKPFIVALALENGRIKPREVFPTAKPQMIGGVEVKDAHITTALDTKGIIRKSSNIGAAILAERLGRRALGAMYRKLGFGGGQILGMPGETAGRLRESEKWRPSELVTHGYGYGLSASLIQLLAGYSVFATDGQMVHPRLEKNITPRFRRVFDSRAIGAVRAMMESVVSEDGTAPRAAIDGYRVAGKTGTAIKIVNGGYSQDGARRAFFIGLAPASAPRYVAAVMIDEPIKNGRGGGSAAGPVFREIMRRTLLFNAVAPDAPEELPDV